jgi:hypothetical protein
MEMWKRKEPIKEVCLYMHTYISAHNLTDLQIGKISIDAQSKIARKSPWCRCPSHKRCTMCIAQHRKRHIHFRIRYILCQYRISDMYITTTNVYHYRMYVFELPFAKRDFQCKVNFIKIYFEMKLLVFEYLFTQ